MAYATEFLKSFKKTIGNRQEIKKNNKKIGFLYSSDKSPYVVIDFNEKQKGKDKI